MIKMIMGYQDQIGLGTILDHKRIQINHHPVPIDSEAVMTQPVDVGSYLFQLGFSGPLAVKAKITLEKPMRDIKNNKKTTPLDLLNVLFFMVPPFIMPGIS
jgi:hypothetical protein